MADAKTAAALAQQAALKKQTRQVQTWNIKVPVQQQLDSSKHTTNSGVAAWTCIFDLELQPMVLSVKVPIFPGTATGTGQSNWKTAIESVWKGANFKYTDKRTSSPTSKQFEVNCTVEWASAASANVNVLRLVRAKPILPARDWRAPKPELGPSYNQTKDTEVWGEGDNEGVPHEYGHLIGNPDEYDLVAFQGAPAPPPLLKQAAWTLDSIMNNPTSKYAKVYPRHYAFVAKSLLEKLGHSGNNGEITITCEGASLTITLDRWAVLA
jgi:hypothetical protein